MPRPHQREGKSCVLTVAREIQEEEEGSSMCWQGRRLGGEGNKIKLRRYEEGFK